MEMAKESLASRRGFGGGRGDERHWEMKEVEEEGEEKQARMKQKGQGRKKGKGSRERQGRRNRGKIKIGGYVKAISSPNFNYFTFSKILHLSIYYFK